MERAEGIGLGFATAGHVALFALLSQGFGAAPDPLKLRPEAVEVAFVDAVALESMARQSDPPPAAQAPELGAATPDVAPTPDMATAAAADPAPKAEDSPPPTRVTPTPKPTPRVEARTPPAKPAPTKSAPTKAAPTKTATTTKPASARPAPSQPARASRLGDDFLRGITDSETPPRRNAAPSAPVFGQAEARALNSEINRQLRPHWRPPSGSDADMLVTELSVRLDREGRVIGRPEVIAQRGITDSNRTQATLHAERAIQAVMRAAPFQNLPPEHYDQWSWLKPLRFDARLTR